MIGSCSIILINIPKEKNTISLELWLSKTTTASKIFKFTIGFMYLYYILNNNKFTQSLTILQRTLRVSQQISSDYI